MRRLLLAFIGMLVSSVALGQQAKIDSLKRVLPTVTDTTRVAVLQALTIQLAAVSYTEAMAYAQKGLAESKRANWRKGEAISLAQVSRLYFRQGEFAQAQQHMLLALRLWQQLEQKKQAWYATLFIADLLAANNQYAKAMIWERRALIRAQAMQDTNSIARSYMGLGILKARQNRPSESDRKSVV